VAPQRGAIFVETSHVGMRTPAGCNICRRRVISGTHPSPVQHFLSNVNVNRRALRVGVCGIGMVASTNIAPRWGAPLAIAGFYKYCTPLGCCSTHHSALSTSHSPNNLQQALQRSLMEHARCVFKYLLESRRPLKRLNHPVFLHRA
jgi:hypothetical protein